MLVLKLFKRNRNNNFKKVLKFFLILSLTLLAWKFFLGYRAEANNLKHSTIDNIKVISEESLVNEIKNVNKIIPLEVELSKTVTIDKSWGDLEILKKYKRIRFFANCSYSIDLSQITTDDIDIDDKNRELSLTLAKPEIFSININREKTEYEESSNGLLRFGEIKLTSEEFDLIQEEVHKGFEETMKSVEIYNKVISNTKVSLEKLLDQITEDKISINISFK
ncbi:DUF4230 domain-containing protein [Bacillus cereus]|uniref:DUF4230 domain-containing protein n=1 Tax=Bacillota TaxID=1239 RepID=UPI00214A3269|nr:MULTISPECIES: DUF4230 domain-containing protein [Bacillota]MCR1951976.1 DUF4230 domain-containing protein [Clostridium sp. DSM 100503]MCR2013806.1 DUF4230 domain-containing protein [Bacillus cereus]